MPAKKLSTVHSIGRQLAMTHKIVHENAERALAAHDASMTTWIVLNQALLAEPPGFSQRELADGMAIGGPALVRHIDRLEAEGLVAREPDPNDRRITRISITPAGRERHAELTTIVLDLDAQLRSLLTPKEVHTLFSALSKIEEHALAQQARSRAAAPHTIPDHSHRPDHG